MTNSLKKTVVVSEQDSLHVELQDDILEPQWEIVVSDDKMEAVLKVVPGARIYRRLKEKAPHSYIQLEVEEHLIPVTIETGPVMEKLRELGIVYGIDYTQIASACTSDEPGVFVIAKGNPPKPGKNGCFLSLQDMEIKNGLKERSDGTVDYREIREFPSTQPGQVLGIVQPPVPGMPGTTVTNEPVFPPEVLPLVVHEGKGIVLVGDGTKVVATEAGHPLIKEKGTTVHISVVPKLMIAKDVDLQTGNLHFVGDVEIVGSIQDAMLVEAQGNVLVHHNVNRAKIFAGSSIIIRKKILFQVKSTQGKNHMLIAEIHHILGDLIQQMRSMINAIHQLSTVSAFKVSSFSQAGLGPLIKILCDGKFKSFPQLTTSLIHKIQSGTGVLEESWAEFSERLYKGFMLTHSEFRSVEEMVQLMKRAEQLFTDTQENSENADCFIKAGYTLNSQLYSSGDIVIMEQGVYNSKLYAGGFIEVDGYIRGGEIYAAKGVKISEAGAKGGMSTRITVPKGETIRLNRVMEDTMIQIGTKMHKFTTQSSNVYARLDEEGQLLIK